MNHDSRAYRMLSALVAIGVTACSAGSPGEGASPPAASSVSVDVLPRSAQTTLGSSVNFAAAVTGTADLRVTWTVTEATGGTVNSGGVYTAPAGTGTFHVVARSMADSTAAGTAVVTVVASPTVTVAINPRTSTVASGASTTFSATVTNASSSAVTWSVQESSGCGAILQTGAYTAPNVATTTTCHVTAASQSSPSSTDTATVTVVPPPASNGPTNLSGIGVNGGDDWMGDKLYANAFRIAHNVSGTVDSNGWPTSSSFTAIVFEACTDSDMAGTWGLRFKGRVTNVTGATITPTGGSWAAAFDGTYTTATMTNVSGYLALTFTGAYRSAGTSSPGVTDIQVMYPTAPGSTTPHGWNEFTHRVTRLLLQRFSAIRFMDFLQISAEGTGNRLALWSDRLTPLYAHWGALQRTYTGAPGPSYIGGPMEDMIRICNEVGVDCYLNIPAYANDDFVMKTAQLFAYGSDGNLPYTGPYGSTLDPVSNPRPAPQSPAFPPLAPNLNLYIEYSNEIWNTMPAYITQYNYVASQAKRDGMLDFDGQIDNLMARWWTHRTVQVSNIFRSVFGDAAMMARIRPLLESQFTNPYTTWGQVTFLMGFYNNMNGNFVGPGGSFSTLRRWEGTGGIPAGPVVDGAHPPSYYIYGGGGSGYYSPANESAALPGFWTNGDMNVATWTAGNAQERHQLAAAGLRRVAYEGGPGFDAVTTQERNAFNNATMLQNFVDHHNAWSAFGGDLLVYYQLANGYAWGFLQPDATHPNGNLFGPDSYKLQAVSQLKQTAPASIDFGSYNATAIPGSRAGGGVGTSDGDYNSFANSGSRSVGANQWVSYTFYNDAELANLSVKVTLSSANGSLAVFFDGEPLGAQTASNGTLTFPLAKAARGIHGVAIRGVTGSFTVTQVAVQ